MDAILRVVGAFVMWAGGFGQLLLVRGWILGRTVDAAGRAEKMSPLRVIMFSASGAIGFSLGFILLFASSGDLDGGRALLAVVASSAISVVATGIYVVMFSSVRTSG